MIIDEQINTDISGLINDNNVYYHDIIKELSKKDNILYTNNINICLNNINYIPSVMNIKNVDLLNFFNNKTIYIIFNIVDKNESSNNDNQYHYFDNSMRFYIITINDPNYSYIKSKIRKNKINLLIKE